MASNSKIDSKAKTRVLLNLWNLGRGTLEVNKSELTKEVKLSRQKALDYSSIYEELEKENAIALTTKNRSVTITITDKGLQMLEAGLKSPDFHYHPPERARTKDFNAVLNWLVHFESNGKASEKITTYEEFKRIALDVYDKLNRDYNLDHLVPIYRIRREIGDRVTRSEFSEWLLEMQALDEVQLIGGQMTEITPDKAEDSIKTELGAIRYFVKRLKF